MQSATGGMGKCVALGNDIGTPGQTITVNATLRHAVGAAALGGETISVSADGASVGTAVTNAAGTAGLKYTIPAGDAAGAHTLTASFAGDGTLLAGAAAGTLIVNKSGVGLSVPAASGLPGQSVTLSATLKRSTGAALAGASLSFSVDGTVVGTATTNASGMATLSCTIASAAMAGGHTVTVTFGGDASDSAGTGQGTLTVKVVTSLAVATVSGSRGTTVILSATLTAAGGVGASGKPVTFVVDGRSAGATTTTASGAVSRVYAIPAAVVGNHTVTATFAGDSSDGGASGTVTLTVH